MSSEKPRALGGAAAIVAVIGLCLAACGVPDAAGHVPVADDVSSSPLGRLADLDVGAVAYVEGTVVENRGPEVSVKDGRVRWATGGALPSIVVTDVSATTNLERPPWPDEPDFYGQLVDSLKSSKSLEFFHSDGHYEVGVRYGLILVPSEPGRFGVIYGHDLEADRPAIGFNDSATREVIQGLADRARDSGDVRSRARLIAELARDVNASMTSGRAVGEVEEVFGPTPTAAPPPTLPRGMLPRLPGETPAVSGEFSQISGFVFVDLGTSDEFAIKFGDETLGWFAPEENGIVYVYGDARVGPRPSAILSRSVVNGTPGEVRVASTLESVTKTTEGERMFLIDLSDSQRSGVMRGWQDVTAVEANAAVLRILEARQN